jgi:hypothetical protein
MDDTDGHPAPDHERQATEHPLLAHVVLAGQGRTHPLGEPFVESHASPPVECSTDDRLSRASGMTAGTALDR